MIHIEATDKQIDIYDGVDVQITNDKIVIKPLPTTTSYYSNLNLQQQLAQQYAYSQCANTGSNLK